MRLTRRIVLQLTIFSVLSVVVGAVMVFGYVKAPANLFGFGRYTVTVQLPESGNLYPRANVTYRGSEVGIVEDVRLSADGVVAVLSLKKGISIPSNLDAQVHSQTPLGEQYLALTPRAGVSAPLKGGDIVPRDRSSVGPDTGLLLDSITTGLKAIPRDNLKIVIDESYTAIGGLGPELARIIDNSTRLTLDARNHLDSIVTLIDKSGPVLDSQADTSRDITAWATNLASITRSLRDHDNGLATLLRDGPPAARQTQQLIDRVQPTLPIILANLVSINQVAITYQPGIEQLLVLLPPGVADLEAGMVANQNTIQPYRGAYLDFNLNINLPPVCNTGFLPPQQQRPPAQQDYPDRPAGDLYCRVPQESMFNVRGARNYPCETRPGKRAPTVKMCESTDNFVPLNDGFSWKGDPNATLSGQGVPQLPPPPSHIPPGAPPPPLAAAEYDPTTGTYTGPDARRYTQSELSPTAPKERTWQSMLMPPN